MAQGYYCLADLYSQGATRRQKEKHGLLPWSDRTIQRMWAAGKFPRPFKLLGRNTWKAEVIDEYRRLFEKGVALAEAAVQAEAAMG